MNVTRPTTVLILSLAVGLAIVSAPGLVALVVPAAFFLVLTIVVTRSCGGGTIDETLRHRFERWALIAFVAHFALGLFITAVPQLSVYLGADASQYHDGARQLSAFWFDGGGKPTALITEGKSGFTYVLAVLYSVVGPHRAAGLALNAFFAASLVPLMGDATHRLFGRGAAWRVAPLVVLPIGFLLWPAQLLREAGVLFFMAMALNAAVRLRERMRPRSLLAFSFAIGSLFSFRHYVAFAMAGGVVIGLSLARRGIGGLNAAAGAAVLLGGLVFGLGLGYGGVQALRSTSFKQANGIRHGSATEGASGFLADADVSTTQNALLYLPRSIPRMLLGPFPWEVRAGRQLPALVDVAVIWALVPALRRGWRSAKGRYRVVLFLMLPTGFLSIVLSLLVANYGTVVRTRAQILLLVVPIIALGRASPKVTDEAEGPEALRAAGSLTTTPGT
jgi:hypothetical protein